MSGRPSASGLGSPSGSAARPQAEPKKPTGPPVNGGPSASGAWRCSATSAAAIAYGSPPSARLQRTTLRGSTPMNDQRPTRWPCSADSSRNAGPVPRSFRNAETGVSVSAMKVSVTGMTLWSAATAIEHPFGVGEAEPAGVQQHGQVVEHVGGLLGHALVGLLAGGAGDLLGLLLHLAPDRRRVREQLRRPTAGGRLRFSRGDHALEHRQRLVRRRLARALEEAGPLARVAGGPGRLDQRQQRVGVAVPAQLAPMLEVARGLGLLPEL